MPQGKNSQVWKGGRREGSSFRYIGSCQVMDTNSPQLLPSWKHREVPSNEIPYPVDYLVMFSLTYEFSNSMNTATTFLDFPKFSQSPQSPGSGSPVNKYQSHFDTAATPSKMLFMN